MPARSAAWVDGHARRDCPARVSGREVHAHANARSSAGERISAGPPRGYGCANASPAIVPVTATPFSQFTSLLGSLTRRPREPIDAPLRHCEYQESLTHPWFEHSVFASFDEESQAQAFANAARK